MKIGNFTMGKMIFKLRLLYKKEGGASWDYLANLMENLYARNMN